MPLRDHFRQPLSPRRHWHAFHNAWATAMAWDLNRRLPQGFFAEPNVHFGIEIDVATWEEAQQASTVPPALARAGTSSPSPLSRGAPDQPSRAFSDWTPPTPTQTVPFTLITDIVEVAVYKTDGGSILVGAVELVSPANKDRPEHREAFVAKLKTYLQDGLGLVLVDIVSERKANLHDDLLRATAPDAFPTTSHGSELYACAYRAVEHEQEAKLEIWFEELSLKKDLPTLPLWLRGGPCLPVDLNGTYEQTCREMRIADR